MPDQPGSLYEPQESQWQPVSLAHRPRLAWEKPEPPAPGLLGEAAVLTALSLMMAALLWPAFQRHQARTHLLTCEQNLAALSTAMELYRSDYGLYPTRLESLAPNYLRTLPSCPSAEADCYRLDSEPASRTLSATKTPPGFTIFCAGSHHSDLGLGENFPATSRDQGLRERP